MTRSSDRTSPCCFRFRTRETFESELNDPYQAKVLRAKTMLAAYDARHPVRNQPIQAIRFGNDLTLLSLGGEDVVDYALPPEFLALLNQGKAASN